MASNSVIARPIPLTTNNQAIHQENYDLATKGGLDSLISELNLRHECRITGSLEACGLNPDKIRNHTDPYGRNLLSQLVTADITNDANTKQQLIEAFYYLQEEGLDPYEPVESDGDTSLSLAVKYDKGFLVEAILPRCNKSGACRTKLLDHTVNGDNLAHTAARFQPYNHALHTSLRQFGFDYQVKNKKGWSVNSLMYRYKQEL